MKSTVLKCLALLGCVLALLPVVTPIGALRAQAPAPAVAAAGKATGTIVTAAQAFLATLDAAQRGKVVFDFKDNDQRRRWSNLPVGIFERTGLRVGDLTPAQSQAMHALLAAAFSKQGYEKIFQIVEGDEVLKRNDKRGSSPPKAAPSPSASVSGGVGDPKGVTGGPPRSVVFGHDEFFISLLGQPSNTEPWMLQFGGHHLAINVTFVGGQATLAPSHTAAQPAIYEVEGKTIRPLGRETEKGFALFSSLSEAQRKQAVIGSQMADLVLGPGRDGQKIAPEGIRGADLSDKQREMLLDLASEWTGIQNEDVAAAKMAEMKRDIAQTYFAWSGPAEMGLAYFRIQGPSVHIELAPQRLGGDVLKHIHTIYRDPTNDYGAKWRKL